MAIGSASKEVDERVKNFMKEQNCADYSHALKAVLASDEDLARRYHRGDDSIDDDIQAEGDRVHEAVIQYMGKHNTENYSTALKAVVSEAATQSDEAHVEFAARTQAYSDHFGLGRSEAAAQVLAHDPELRAHVTDAHLFERDATGQLGVLLNGLRTPENAPDIPAMLEVGNLERHRDLVQQAAGERLVSLANEWFLKNGIPAAEKDISVAMAATAREHRGLNAAWSNGRLNEDALRDIFWPWFSRDKDSPFQTNPVGMEPRRVR